jgi:periplasmic copper chaperone A
MQAAKAGARGALGAVALSLMVASPAAAHTELHPTHLPPGPGSEAALILSHGCADDEALAGVPEDDPPTTGVEVAVPEGVDVDPFEIEGWTLSLEQVPAGRVTSMRWDLDDAGGTTATIALPFSLVVPEAAEGTELVFPVVQDCLDGEQLLLTEPGRVRGGGAIPAPRIYVDPGASPSDLRGLVDLDADTRRVADAEVSPRLLDRLGWPSVMLVLAGSVGLAIGLVRRPSRRVRA